MSDQAGLASARRLSRAARFVLIPVAVIGAVLSFRSLYLAAEPVFGPDLAAGFPLLVDALILGASLQYVAGAKVGRARAGWRLTAHAGVVATLVLNALASHSPAEIPWHVTAPAVWSVLVELTAREVLGEWKAAHRPPADRIPARLWLTAPVESVRTWLRLARRVDGEQAAARLEVGLHAAAVEALRLALPGRRARRARRILTRQLRAGSLSPVAVLAPLGWIDDGHALPTVTPGAVLRAALRDTLLASVDPVTEAVSAGTGTAVAPGAEKPAMQTLDHSTRPTSASPGPALSGDSAVPTGEAVSAAASPAAAPSWTSSASGSPTGSPTGSGNTAVSAARTGQGALAERTMPHTPAGTPDRGPSPSGTDRVRQSRPTASTGNRLQDAVALLQADPQLSGARLAAQLRGLGWELSNRTGTRVLAEALDQMPPRLSAVH